MATFKFGRAIDIHWNGYDIQGPAETVFSIPDQLYEEFDADISPVEPTLVWLDTNEFQTLQDSVVTSTIVGSAFITTASTTAGTQISIVSQTATDGYVLTADGAGGVAFEAAPGGGGSLSSVIGTSPMSVLTSSGTATVSINQSEITGATAATNAQVVRFLVKNTTGTTIPKGSAVYVSGATGDNALISLASATSDPSSSKTLGITAEAIANDAFGYVIEAGYLTDIDTSATTAGAAVWLGNTPGSLVFVSPPAEPSHAVYLGVVVRVQAINGSILVKVQNGYELDELHDVFVSGVSTALPLVYNSTSSGWIAQALTSVGIADNAVVESKILDGSVTSSKIADGSITSSKIAAGAVGSSAIAANAVVAGDIAAGAVGSAEIAAGSINSTHIAANAVVLGDISPGAVDSSALANNAVVAAKIAASSVGVVAISSGTSTSGTVLTSNGSGGVTFEPTASSNLSINAQTATTYTLVLSDAAKLIELSNTSAITFTIPPNSSVAFPVGTKIDLLQTNTGQVTVGGAGVTLNTFDSRTKLGGQWAAASIIKRATDTWVIIGNITA
jgi:hypothetical protein